MIRQFTSALLLSLTGLASAACSPKDAPKDAPKQSGSAEAPAAAASGTLTGAGATFPNPIYTKWFDAYARTTGVRINYQSIGSGGGIRQFTEGTVDFGASDGPMTDAQVAAVQGNVRPHPDGARRRGAHLQRARARHHRAQVRRADHRRHLSRQDHQMERSRGSPRSTPAPSSPTGDIIVAHRSDGSGTSYIFTDYLSKVSPEWSTKVGRARRSTGPSDSAARATRA